MRRLTRNKALVLGDATSEANARAALLEMGFKYEQFKNRDSLGDLYQKVHNLIESDTKTIKIRAQEAVREMKTELGKFGVPLDQIEEVSSHYVCWHALIFS
jgi:hypothetical protein